ncbi:patatin-like phospholipase [Sinobacterium caligoides]|uniref:Patatin-like phospholipase n=1 Tax=Sinobacterium caligoides TaxID=933926 RepID=A0A3N2DPK8_9GAMM|nr:patatin-like phospholipase family protein [Sinobacterium caligoides]ROS01255.1 patatin-like phospholipase [Sinobacterium caligoides]
MTKIENRQPNKLTAYCLQGGGALGAYELGAMKGLAEKGYQANVVTGISIGAINAAIYASYLPPSEDKDNVEQWGSVIEKLESFWQDVTVDVDLFRPPQWLREYQPIGEITKALEPLYHGLNWLNQCISRPYNPGMYTLDWKTFLPFSPFFCTALCDTTRLRNTLEKYITRDNLAYLNNKDKVDRVRLTVLATEIKNGKITLFSNFDIKDDDVNSAWNVSSDEISIDNILASGAFPPGFPMVECDGKEYWDGGLFQNNSTRTAIRSLHLMAAELDTPNLELELFNMSLYPSGQEVPRNFFELYTTTGELRFEEKDYIWEDIHRKTLEYRKFAEMVKEKYPNDNELFSMDGFKKLNAYREINFIEVKLEGHNSDPTMIEKLLDPSGDFTVFSIENRIKDGVLAAKKALAEQVAKAPKVTTVTTKTTKVKKTSIKAGETVKES